MEEAAIEKQGEPVVTLSIGVDLEHGTVVLDLSVPSPTPVKVRLCYDEAEAARLAHRIVACAAEVRTKKLAKQQVVLPQKAGKILRAPS